MRIKKNSKLASLVAVALVMGALLVGTFGNMSVALAAPGGPGNSVGPRITPTTPLDADEIVALRAAINEEYLALNTYQAAIRQLGNIIPFSQIANAEQQHVNTLAQLFTKYGVAVPVNPGLTPAPVFANRTAACQVGVNTEISDAALYDQLRPQIHHQDILQVFANLKTASLTKHLPAFDACN